MTEVQDSNPSVKIPLERIGFKNLRRRIALETPIGVIQLDIGLEVYISISEDRRGAHLSRSAEAMIEALQDISGSRSIEEYLESIARRLMEKHDYAKQVEVRAHTTYYVEVQHSEKKSIEPVSVDVEYKVERSGLSEWSLSVAIAGITACPSAQQTIASKLGIPASISPTHMQKVILKGRITSRRGFARIERIARALYKSFSAPAFTILKREEEAELILKALQNPKLLEDVVREAVASLALEFKDLPSDTIIEVEAESFESIHPHNLYAYKRALLGELVNILASSLEDKSANTSIQH